MMLEQGDEALLAGGQNCVMGSINLFYCCNSAMG